LGSEWKRRYLTLVADNLYIWTSHRSKAPTARLKLKGVAIDIFEYSENSQDSQKKYLILSKRSKTKLVLNADSKAEFEGWYKTLKDTCRIASGLNTDTETESEDKRSYENVEIPVASNRGRDPVKITNKVPIPTPRNRTPSRDSTPACLDNESLSLESIKNTDSSDKASEEQNSLDVDEPILSPSKKNSLYLEKYNHLRINEVGGKEKEAECSEIQDTILERPDSVGKSSLTAFELDEIDVMDSSTQSSFSNVKGEIDFEKDEKVNSSEILYEESPPPKPNVYIDIDGKWKLELNDNSLEDESIVDEGTGEEEEAVKWCTPVSVISDDSSSEDEKIKFCKPVHSEGHKFSDGIVWETIEECDEEESSNENDSVHQHKKDNMNESVQEVKKVVKENNLNQNSVSQKMNGVSNEAHLVSSNNTQSKKELQQSHQAVTSQRSHSFKPERDSQSFSRKVGKSLVGSVSVGEMDTPNSMCDDIYQTFDDKCQIQDERNTRSLDVNFTDTYSFPSELQQELSNTERIKDGESSQLHQTSEETNEDVLDAPQVESYFEKINECQISKDEMGNISVKNMAKFWEEVSKKIQDAASKTEPKIQKKWNSMPDLKDRYEKRKLPATPTQEKIERLENVDNYAVKPEPVVSNRQIIKSDEVIDDVDLCRSVSIRDRKQMFEMMAKQARKEKKKQWSSMPSLKQERPQTRQPSPEKGKVRWEDEFASDDEEEHVQEEPRLQSRGKSPIKEIMKAFEVNKTRQPTVSVSKPNEISNRYSHSRMKSPVSPLLHTNEIFNYRDDFHSSSDSVSSSLTSASTVVPRSPGIPSMLEDSGGEIYTDGINKSQEEHGLFVFENGNEFSLTPVNKRKSMFEIHKKSGRVRKISKETAKQNKIIEPLLEAPVDTPDESESQILERIKSSNIPYIEEEKNILENIRMVQSLKMKFLK